MEVDMKIPYDGKVSARLVEKRFSGKIFYFLQDQQQGKGYAMRYGFLKFSGGDLKSPMIRHFGKDNKLGSFCQHCSWDNVFDRFEDAERALSDIKSLYNDGFSSSPFIRLSTLRDVKGDLLDIELKINRLLRFDSRFDGNVRFSDVSAGGIQVYTNYANKTINYDFSNKNDVVIDLVESWFKFVNEQGVEK